jgi:hypothetical protein
MSNAWDEQDDQNDGRNNVQQDDGENGLKQGDTDGFSEDQGFNEPTDEVEDVPAKSKKKGPNPKIIAGILGLVMVGVIGAIGFNFYKKMAKPKATPVQAIALQPEAAMPASIPPAAPPVNAAPVANQEAQMTAPPWQSPAAATQSGSAMADIAISGGAASADDTQIKQQFASIDSRISSLELSVKKISDAVASGQMSVNKNRVEKAKVAAAATAGKAENPIRKSRTAGASTEGIKESVVQEAPATYNALQLRGVYPPTGDDRQAWVLDSETNVITIVSKGSIVNGMTVIRVDADRVVTNKGIIR